MKDQQKTKAQLLDEIQELRQRVRELEGMAAKSRPILEPQQMNETLYSKAFDTVPDAVMLFDAETRDFIAVNDAAVRCYGYSRAEFLALKHTDITAKVEESDSSIERTLKEDTMRIPLRYHRKKDGSLFPVEISASTFSLQGRNVICGVVRDITERKLAEEKAIRFNRVLERSLNEIYLFDAETLNFIEVNRGARENLGYSMEEFYGLTPLDLKPEFTPESLAKLVQPLRAGNQEKVEFTTVHQRKDGTQYPVEVHLQLLTDGTPVFAAIVLDVTERKQAEESLQRSEERFRQIAETSREWLWEVDSDGLYTYASPIVKVILGYKPEELVGRKHFYDLFHPEVREQLKETAFAVFAKRQKFRGFINRTIAKDGEEAWLSTSGLPLLDENGHFLGYRGADVDITALKYAEEELAAYRDHLEEMVDERTAELDRANRQLRLEIAERKQAEENVWLLSSAVEQSSEGIAVSDIEGRLIFVNQAFASMHGYSSEELIGKLPSLFYSPDQLPAFREVARQILEMGEFHGEVEHIRRDGSVFPLAIANTIFRDESGKPTGVIGTQHDITERKRAEALARTSSQRVEYLVSSAPTVIYSCEVGGNWAATFVTKNVEKTWGYKASDFLEPDFWMEHLHPDDRDRVFSGLDELLKNGSYEHEYRFRMADGTYHWISDGLTLLYDDHGKPLECVGSCTDITERKSAEEALRKSEEKYRMLVESMNDGLGIQDENGLVTFVNDAFCEMIGYAQDELVGRLVADLIAPDHRDSFNEDMARRRMGENAPYETVFRRKDGQTVHTLMSPQRIEDAERRFLGSFAVITDITESKRMEEAFSEISFREQERIRRDLHDSVGQDLTGLSGMARSLTKKLRNLSLPEADAAEGIVRGIQQTLDDVQSAIKGLGPVEMDPLGLMVALEELVNTMQSQHDMDVQFVCRGQVTLEDNSSATHLFRIAQEAVTNAVKHSKGKHITVSLTEEDGRLSLEIHDDGAGIGEKADHSEGMGLRIMRHRAKTVGTELTIDSPDGDGTSISCTYTRRGIPSATR